MGRVPISRVRTSHALTIKANGVSVGLINGWNPTQSRTVTPIYEVGFDNSGNPVELMPGNINAQQVSINRYDTYITKMEEAFGTPDLVMLTRQNQPFDVLESWVIPDPSLIVGDAPISLLIRPREKEIQTTSSPSPFTKKEKYLYSGCWFTSLGRTLRSDDNRIVNVTGTLMYTKKLKITGLAGAAVSF